MHFYDFLASQQITDSKVLQNMNQQLPSHEAKVTLSQLQRYLPLPPPSFNSSLPAPITQFMLSPSYNNLSIREQRNISDNYHTVYRNHFQPKQLVEHLQNITHQRFTPQSIEQALVNAAEDQGLVDWYRFVRAVSHNTRTEKQQTQSKSQLQAASLIQNKFRTYRARQKQFRAYRQITILRNSLQARLLSQLVKEAQTQIFQHVQRNRLKSEEILFSKHLPPLLSYSSFEELINRQLECGLDSKKVQYLFIGYERPRTCKVDLQLFRKELLPQRKVVEVANKGQFLKTQQEVLALIRQYTMQTYYTWQDLVQDYQQHYTSPSQDQLSPTAFYTFLKDKCANQISWYQAEDIRQLLKYTFNLKYLYVKGDPRQLAASGEQEEIKRKKKRQLKKENPVYYSFRTILLLLLAKSKASKLTRQEFISYMVQEGPHLKYQAFYTVWRVYPSLINITRMRQDSQLPILACHLLLKNSPDQYDTIVEQLLDLAPSQSFEQQQASSATMVPYSKVEENINLQLDFILETQKLKPLNKQPDDLVDYRQAILQILPLDIQIQIRKYIFRKISQKFVAIWKSIKAKKQLNRKALNAFAGLFPLDQSQKSLGSSPAKHGTKPGKTETAGKKQDRLGKKMNTLSSKQPVKQVKKVTQSKQLENYPWVGQLLQEVVYSVADVVASKLRVKNDASIGQKSEFFLTGTEKYCFRSSLTRVDFHWLLGAISYSRDFVSLKNGEQRGLNLKLPFRPGIVPLDLAIWEDKVAVVTSLCSLTAGSMYSQFKADPQRTIQLHKQGLTQQHYDLKVGPDTCRMHRQLPWLLRAEGPLLLVNLLPAQKIVIVDQDPTKSNKQIPLTWSEHFLLPAVQKILKTVASRQSSEKQIFVQLALATVNQHSQSSQKESCYQQELTKYVPDASPFEWRSFVNWLKQLSCAAKTSLKHHLRLRRGSKFSGEVEDILRKVREHMLLHNWSIDDLLKAMGCESEGIGTKEVKRYLGRLVGFESVGGATQQWLNNLSKGKKIQYGQLAAILMQQWKWDPIQKPLLMVCMHMLVPHMPLLLYTLVGSPHLYVRHTEQNVLIAVLRCQGSVTPIFCLIPQQMVVLSTTPKPQVLGRAQAGEDILVWRLQEDLIDCHHERPPWNSNFLIDLVNPHARLNTDHQAPISALCYSSRINTLISSSLDGTLRLHKVTNPLGLVQSKKVYQEECHYLSCALHLLPLLRQVPLQCLLTVSINQQINHNNAQPYQLTVQLSTLQHIRAKVPAQVQALPAPLRLQEAMHHQAIVKHRKKKALQIKWQRHQIQTIDRGRMAFKSLDHNFYQAIKAAFIFGYHMPLRRLLQFVSTKKYKDMVLRQVKQEYGLQLLEDQAVETSPQGSVRLGAPPSLSNTQRNINRQNQFLLPQDAYQNIIEQLDQQTGQTIDQDALGDILRPHLPPDSFQQLLETLLIEQEHLLQGQSQVQLKAKSKRYNKKQVKQILKPYQLQGSQAKLFSALRHLQYRMRKIKIPLWELFASSVSQLHRQTSLRNVEFESKASLLGMTAKQSEAIVSYLSRGGTINLFELQHFAKMALEEANPSDLLSNYSTMLFGQSLMKKIPEEQPPADADLEQSLHCEIKNMLQHKESRAESDSGSLRSSQRPKKDEEMSSSQLRHSASQNSIRSSKDEPERKARLVIRKLGELLRNEGKSLWDIVGVVSQNFISQPFLTDSEYFAMFGVLKTPLRLADKLDLLAYLKREGEGRCDLNVLFQMDQITTQTASQKKKVQGDKHLALHLLDKLQNNYSSILEQALQKAFFPKQAETDQQGVLTVLQLAPFNCCKFALHEWQLVLKEEKLSRSIGVAEMSDLLHALVQKHKLNIRFDKLTLVQELIRQIDQKGASLTQLFPQSKGVTFSHFEKCVAKISSASTSSLTPDSMEEDFKNLAYAQGKGKQGLKAVLNWEPMVKQLDRKIAKARQEQGLEGEASRKLVKALAVRRMCPFEFFISMDRNRQYYLSQEQFQAGLVEVGIDHDLWADIPKKNQRRMSYNTFLQYLVKKGVLPYKSVDSQLQIAMNKLLKRYIRHEDLQKNFRRMAGEANEVDFSTFSQAMNRVDIPKEEAIILFGMFVNERVVRGKQWGNDEAVNDPNNLRRSFNFKQFAEVVLTFKTENLTKTVPFRFYDFFRKRNISLFFEYKKWLDNNRKLKEVSECLKKHSQVLPKDTFLLFLDSLHSPLSEAQLKQLVMKYNIQVDFQVFMTHLEDLYKRANSKVELEEVQTYLQEMVRKMEEQSVGLPRLIRDYSDGKGRMGLTQLAALNEWLGTGLSKIQLRKITTVLDKEKEGKFKVEVLAQAVQQAQQTMDKDETDYQLEYIIEKLLNHPDKYVLKNSKLAFTPQRAHTIFEALLSSEQSDLLLSQACLDYKKATLSEKEFQEWVQKKTAEARGQLNKKDKETALRLLNFIKKVGLEVDELFSYWSRHNTKQQLAKQEFLILYQSLELKNNLSEVNSLFALLEEKNIGVVTKTRWEEKLGMLRVELEQQLTVSPDELKLFYKVKIYLADVYLLFVRKAFKPAQIYHFFDRHATGLISPNDLLNSLQQLGHPPDSSDLQAKLVNYLDRKRDGRLQVSYVLYELEHCIGSKMRLILNTRTSILFREKSKVFKDQGPQFIGELARKEELSQLGNTENPGSDSYRSTISEASFIELLREFGCRLGEDQIQDIRHNFQTEDGQLLLYPIYHSFVSLFEGEKMPSTIRHLYERFMRALVKNNVTVGRLQQLSTQRELLNFIEQIHVFTPIQARTIVGQCLFPFSQAVDYDLLKRRLRDAYINQDQKIINNSIMQLSAIQERQQQWMGTNSGLAQSSHPDDYEARALRRQLAQVLPLAALKQTVNNSSITMRLPQFEQLLWECGVWVTKKVARDYFDAFKQGDQLNILKLIQLCETVNQPSKQKTFWGAHQSIVEQDNEEGLPEHDLQKLLSSQEQGSIRMAQHVIKAINLKGSSLEKELNPYYSHNYGLLAPTHILDFLRKTGLDLKQYKEDAKQFLRKLGICSKIIRFHSLEPSTTDQQEKTKQLTFEQQVANILEVLPPKALIPIHAIERCLQAASQICTVKSPYRPIYFPVHSKEVFQLLNRVKQYNLREQLQQWFRNHGIYQFSQQQLYRYIFQQENESFSPKVVALFIKMMPAYVDSIQTLEEWLEEQSLDSLQPLQNTQPLFRTQTLNSKGLQRLLPSKQMLLQFRKRDLIGAYRKAVDQMLAQESAVDSTVNLAHLAAHLFLQQLAQRHHLLLMTPLLTSPQTYPEPSALQINSSLSEYPIQPLNSLTVDYEQQLDSVGLVIINHKYEALPLHRKHQFQSMACLAHLLHPQLVFMRSRNLYLWLPTQPLLPSQALNYSWRLIPSLAQQLLTQMVKVRSAGYCLPHLRYQHLGRDKLIEYPRYPCPISRSGQVRMVMGEPALNFQDACCPPEFYLQSGQRLTAKCDSWVFGCLLYEFIYGHPPCSPLRQLQTFCKSHDLSITELLSLPQLPVEFEYTFYNSNAIRSLLNVEHHLNIPPSEQLQLKSLVKREQTMGALLFDLEVMYGQQFPYYKEEFALMKRINQIIAECLQLDPVLRPSLEQLIEAPPFSSHQISQQLPEYLRTLALHQSTIQFYDQCIAPICVPEKPTKDTVLGCLEALDKKNQLFNDNRKVSSNLVIPKQYPWPHVAEGPFTSRLVAHRQIIRQAANFGTLTLLLQSQFISSLTELAALDSSLLSPFLNLIRKLLPGLKSYESPICGFVPLLLRTLLQLLYRSSLTLPGQQEVLLMGNNLTQLGKKKIGYFEAQPFKQAEYESVIMLLSQLVLVTGEGNPIYQPVEHYLQEDQLLRQAFEVAFKHLELVRNPFNSKAVLQYFLDTLIDPLKKELQAACRVQIDVFFLLASADLQLKLLALQYIGQLANSSGQLVPLFKYPPLYLYLCDMLRSPSGPLSLKQLSLRLVRDLSLTPHKKLLVGSSSALLQEVIRTMIEPPKTSNLHPEYLQLLPLLQDIAEILLQDEGLRQMLAVSKDGAETVLEKLVQNKADRQHIQMMEMNRGTLKDESILK